MKQKFNFFAALFAATVLAFFAGCKAESDPVIDTTPPAKVTLAEKAATSSNNSVLLSWKNPADEDFYAVKISFEPKAADVAQPFLVPGTKRQGVSYLVTGLTNGTKYTFSLVSLDKTLNESEAVTAECTPVSSGGTTAPAVVTNLSAKAKSEAVVLTWSDPTDEDLFGIEISWKESAPAAAASLRAISQMEKNTVFVAPGVQSAEISGLKPETPYTFTVKAMNTSGNKSEGETTSATTLAPGETMKIEPSSQSELSKTSITVTVKITTTGNVEKVVYKKDGSLSAQVLLADTEAKELTPTANENGEFVCSFDVTENGTYTVAALDSDGRRETMQHTVNEFDFVAQNEVKNLTSKYENGKITLTWEIPDPDNKYDSPYDYALISYTSTDSSGTSEPSEPVKIENPETTYTVENIDSSTTYYSFTVQAVDKLGNTSTGTYRLTATISAPEGFISVPGGTVVGAANENNYKGVFIEGRTVTLSPFYMAKYPVTKAQYRAIMSDTSLNTEGITADPSYSTNKPKTYVIAAGENDDNRPVENVSWYDAVYFCNLLSKKEGLQEVYTISDIKTEEAEITEAGADGNQTVTITYISSATVTMDMTKNGYRLPTEAEWEYAARGGNPNAADWNYTFSGAPTASGVAYNKIQNSGLDAVGWYTYNTCNSDGKTGDSRAISGTAGYGTHEVGKKKPNALGLYDMSGNVWERCWDLYSSTVETGTAIDPMGPSSWSSRVLRGGSWWFDASIASVCYRNYPTGSGRSSFAGFRVVRSAQ